MSNNLNGRPLMTSILTFNVADFARLHSQWVRLGRHHAGITQVPIGELIRRLEN